MHMSSPPSIDAPEGIVVAVGQRQATVRIDGRFVCARCAAGRGCGAGIFARSGPRLVEVNLPPSASLRVGQEVSLSLEPQRLLHAAWLVYGVPLFALLAAALAAAYVVPRGASDGAALAIVAAGFLCGGWWARWRLRRAGCAGRFVPTVVGSSRDPSAAGEG
jgi:sigma-E factor negative regulatory protein RseC